MSAAIRILGEPVKAAERGLSRFLATRNALIHALEGPSVEHVWVLRSQRMIGNLIRALAVVPPRVRRTWLISYARPEPLAAQVIEAGFSRALLGVQVMVKLEDLREILSNEHPEDFCIGAEWERESDSVALWRGDLSVLVVPLSAFPTRGGVAADPSRLSIEDCGQTVRLGKYEASFEALLYERDPLYRRRAKKRMIVEERTLGAAIRRLRLSRGLARSEFGNLDPKTLARIERGEVGRPQRATLERIAKRLGVAVEELEEY